MFGEFIYLSRRLIFCLISWKYGVAYFTPLERKLKPLMLRRVPTALQSYIAPIRAKKCANVKLLDFNAVRVEDIFANFTFWIGHRLIPEVSDTVSICICNDLCSHLLKVHLSIVWVNIIIDCVEIGKFKGDCNVFVWDYLWVCVGISPLNDRIFLDLCASFINQGFDI